MSKGFQQSLDPAQAGPEAGGPGLKAISLWQPWASLMRAKTKRNETRSWATTHRGELAICSAKRPARIEEVSDECGRLVWQHLRTFGGAAGDLEELLDSLPLGKVLCVVNAYDCVPTEEFAGVSPVRWLEEMESELGNYEPERFAWLTRDCQALREPVDVVGRQGLWNLPADVEAAVRGQLGEEKRRPENKDGALQTLREGGTL